jgi:proline iminopeptidase
VIAGSQNNDVYCAMTGEDGDFLIAGDLGNFDFRRDLKKVSVPMLILAGRYDRIDSWIKDLKQEYFNN